MICFECGEKFGDCKHLVSDCPVKKARIAAAGPDRLPNPKKRERKRNGRVEPNQGTMEHIISAPFKRGQWANWWDIANGKGNGTAPAVKAFGGIGHQTNSCSSPDGIMSQFISLNTPSPGIRTFTTKTRFTPLGEERAGHDQEHTYESGVGETQNQNKSAFVEERTRLKQEREPSAKAATLIAMMTREDANQERVPNEEKETPHEPETTTNDKLTKNIWEGIERLKCMSKYEKEIKTLNKGMYELSEAHGTHPQDSSDKVGTMSVMKQLNIWTKANREGNLMPLTTANTIPTLEEESSSSCLL